MLAYVIKMTDKIIIRYIKLRNINKIINNYKKKYNYVSAIDYGEETLSGRKYGFHLGDKK